jgi:hypothetical protein
MVNYVMSNLVDERNVAAQSPEDDAVDAAPVLVDQCA